MAKFGDNEKKESMGGKFGRKSTGMGKKSAAFGAKLGKRMGGKKLSMEGPNK